MTTAINNDKSDKNEQEVHSILAHGHDGDIQLFILDTKLDLNPLRRPVLTIDPANALSVTLDECRLDIRLPNSFLAYVCQQKEGRVASIATQDVQQLKAALKRNLGQDLSLSIQREKNLISAPALSREAIQKHQKNGVKIEMVNLETAIQKHWLHLLTGLILNEADQAMLIQGVTPMWCKDLIKCIHVRNFDIRNAKPIH
jgi:hypothetical protein